MKHSTVFLVESVEGNTLHVSIRSSTDPELPAGEVATLTFANARRFPVGSQFEMHEA